MLERRDPVYVVGAGLAGLTAAINLARGGREVIVLEKGKRVGGTSSYNPSLHGTPMDTEAMRRYAGIDLRPGMARLASVDVVIWGRCYSVEFPDRLDVWMVERGPRRSSMDRYLYRLALEEGVRFRFGQPVNSEREVRELPPGSIMATGLDIGGFRATGVPYRILHGFFSKCRVPDSEPRVSVYFDDYTPDYAFTCSMNGIAFGLIFNHLRPVSKWEADKFAEQAVLEDGYPFKRFTPLEKGAVPVSTFFNPRLFQGDIILAGTLAGAIDPILYFGMHGAFLSGKIAALAHGDPAGARREFRRLCRNYYPLLATRKAVDAMPHGVFIKHPVRLALRLMPFLSPVAMRRVFMVNIFGYGKS